MNEDFQTSKYVGCSSGPRAPKAQGSASVDRQKPCAGACMPRCEWKWTDKRVSGSISAVDDMLNLGQLNGVSDPLDPASFMQQLQGIQTNTGLAGVPLFADEALDLTDISAKNRNRGNYRCSKVRCSPHYPSRMTTDDAINSLMSNMIIQCGVPKKGHVCPLIPTNFKCPRCGLSKKACTCVGT